MSEAPKGGGAERPGDAALSDNERLRQANEALKLRIDRHASSAEGDGGWARRYVEIALEASRVALMLFSEEGRLIAVNARLQRLFPDIAQRLIPGLRFEEVVRLIAAASALDLPDDETRRAWARARIAARGRLATPAVAPLVGDRWLEICERRAAHGAFALAFEDVTDEMIARLRDRDGVAGWSARAQGALDKLALGVAAFDRDGGLVLWNEPFRRLLGLGLRELSPGAPFDRIAARVAESGGIDPAGPARRLARWVASGAPRGPLTAEFARAGEIIVEARCTETPDGGFVVSLTDVTDARRAAAEVDRVRRSLELRVTERTAALVELNDRLVQEVAERRAIEAEMRRARDAAEAANLSKTRFLAAASHDLLQPLNAAKLFVSLLTSDDLAPRVAATALKIESAFASVETLLNALLDISKLDAGGGEAQVADFPVARILDPVAEEARPLAAARGLRLRVASSRAVVRSDPHYLRRIVQNLVSNALKYTETGGVVVGCRRRGRMLRIEVWDSGVGVPPAERRRIFEEFHRIDDANPRGERGMGLGLAIVERASRLLGHAVDIRSAEGQGSMFAVTVPLGAQDAVFAPMAVKDGPAALSGGGMIAMVVEDDAPAREAMGALLATWGVDVLTAADGAEALALARQFGMPPDILLVDYHLAGGLTGLDALEDLRAALRAPIPAILITADRTREVARRAEALGAQVLTKPLDPAKLRALLLWTRRERSAAE